MEWLQVFTILGSMAAFAVWIDHRHTENNNKMELRHREDRKRDREDWKWLFDWAHEKMERLDKKNP